MKPMDSLELWLKILIVLLAVNVLLTIAIAILGRAP